MQTWPVSTFTTVHEPLEARDVILGRTQHVRRVLPHKVRRMIGAWCFLDHFGPDDVAVTGGMWVPPHPHTGLQTVTWLFEGEGLHTDSLGSRQLIRPGQLNVMTAGHGICHAEVTPPQAPPRLHGIQLWVCLPDPVRDTATPDFTHLAELPAYADGATRVRVLAGSLGGLTSPAPAFTALVGAEVTLGGGSATTLPLREDFEYGVLAVGGPLVVDGREVSRDQMTYLGCGRTALTVSAPAGSAIAFLVGGEPFEEEIVMWWNFVGRSHDEIVAMREEWNGAGLQDAPPRYGRVADFSGDRLLAPPLPNTRLKPRPRAS
jgi:redox-sensitive bicupin YhaK (pirin superfamily)